MEKTDNSLVPLLHALVSYLILAVLNVLPAALVYLDILWLRDGVHEVSLTEFSQSLLLVLCVITFMLVARLEKTERGFAYLAAGLFLCMLIREQNNFLNAIHHDLWKALVVFVALIAIVAAYREGRATLDSLRHFLVSRAGGILVTGILLLLLFSRTFGMQQLWHAILGQGYNRVAKNVAEEGTEMVAYLIIFYASQIYRRYYHRFLRVRHATNGR